MLCLRTLAPLAFALVALLVCRPLAAVAAPDVTERARKFLDAHTTKLRPLTTTGGSKRGPLS